MASSKISICNVTLSMLGADSIRSFDEKNKRARMCDVFFDFSRDYLLTKFDWPFAKRFVTLQALDTDAMGLEVPSGHYAYGLPSDCLIVRDLAPRGSKTPWYTMDTAFYCTIDPDSDVEVKIYYTALVTDPSKFSNTFSNLLALNLATRVCTPITQDKALTKELVAQFSVDQYEAWEADANASNQYREPDENPDNDTFVNPDGYVDTEGRY